MKRNTVLNLKKINSDEYLYEATPIWEGTRKKESIKGFVNEKYDFIFAESRGFPAILKSNNYNDYKVMIMFYERINHQLFGKDLESGKCIYATLSQPWHKKSKVVELELFESKVNFEDLYHRDYHDGKYIPEFSNKHNWNWAYRAAAPENFGKAIDYAATQPLSAKAQAAYDRIMEKYFGVKEESLDAEKVMLR